MTNQSVRKNWFHDPVVHFFILIVIVGAIFLVTLHQWYRSISTHDFAYLVLYGKAYFWGVFASMPQHSIAFHDSFSTTYISAGDLLNNTSLVDFSRKHFQLFIHKLTIYSLCGVPVWIGVLYLVNKIEQNRSLHHITEGVQQVSVKQHNQLLKTQKLKSHIKIGNAFWTKNAEVQHLLIAGDPGTGKSQLLVQLLNDIRKSGDLAIVYDPKGDMVRDFYQSDTDVLYSPFDSRSPKWDVWQDLNSAQAIETFAEAVIKDSVGKDDFWAKTARMVLVAALKKGIQSELSFEKTIDKLVTSDLDTLKIWLENSEVASDFSNPKTAATILSELKSQVRALKYLSEVPPLKENLYFSINHWMTQRFKQISTDNPQAQPWLFLPINEKFKASATPIMAAQIELISTSILSQSTNHKRRIWIVIDELPSLPKLPALMRLLGQGRGYGVAGILAIQNFSQLLNIYGKDEAHNLTGLCSSVVSMRTSDTQTAEYLSKRFGKHIRKETQNSQSVTKSKHETFNQGHTDHIAERSAVTETELYSLQDLKGFFKAKDCPNPIKIEICIAPMKARNSPHCPIKEKSLKSTANKSRIAFFNDWNI